MNEIQVYIDNQVEIFNVWNIEKIFDKVTKLS